MNTASATHRSHIGPSRMDSQNTQAITLTAREGVPIDNPAAGNWRAEVRGWLTAPQSYTLIIQQYFPLQ